MAFWDAVQPHHVRQAAAEYDELGQDEFLARYGFGRARAYLLIIDGKAYDSKAILGVAYGHASRSAAQARRFQRWCGRRGARSALSGLRGA